MRANVEDFSHGGEGETRRYQKLSEHIQALFGLMSESDRLACVLIYSATLDVLEVASSLKRPLSSILRIRNTVRAEAADFLCAPFHSETDGASIDQRIQESLSNVFPVPPGLERRILTRIGLLDERMQINSGKPLQLETPRWDI